MTHDIQPFRATLTSKRRRLENRSRPEGSGSARDGTVSELHTSHHHPGRIEYGSQARIDEINDNGRLWRVRRHVRDQNPANLATSTRNEREGDREKKATLERLVAVFLGHLSHQRHGSLNGSIQVLACRVRFVKTRIRAPLLG